MAFDKAIKSGKEHRRQYYGPTKHDTSCRPGGGCPWCEGNRTYNDRRRRRATEEELKSRMTTIDDNEEILCISQRTCQIR